MSNLKAFFLVIILLFVSGFAIAQKDKRVVKVYNTLEDYKKGKGTTIGKLNGFSITSKVQLIVDGGRTKVNLKRDWGFTVDGILFRIQKGNTFRVWDIGHIVYYEDGAGHLRILLSNTGDGWVSYEHSLHCYSISLASKVHWNYTSFRRTIINPNKPIQKLVIGLDKATTVAGFEERKAAIRECIQQLNKKED